MSAILLLRKKWFFNFKFLRNNLRFISDVQKKIKDSYYFRYGDVLLKSSTVGQVLDEAADSAGDTTAFISVHQGITKTVYEFRKEADRLASGFVAFGLKRGDRLGLCSPNCYEWPLVQFAAAKAGLVLVNINPAYQAKELEFALKKVECKAVVCWDSFKSNDYYQMLLQIIPELSNSQPGKIRDKNLPNLETVIMISKNEMAGTFRLSDILNSGNRESDEALAKIEKSVQFDDFFNIQYTSGTTGVPKGVMLTHHNIVNNAFVAGRGMGFNLYKNVICVQVPLFHSFGCTLGTISPIMFHQTSLFPCAGYDATSSLTAVEKYKCTSIYGAPTMFIDLLHHTKLRKYNTKSLRQAVLGGSASPESLIKQLHTDLNIRHLSVGYGTTEHSPCVASVGLNEGLEHSIKGILKPFEYVELKVVDKNGNLVPVNTQGELCTRSPYTFIGYWGEEKKTKEVKKETGWYHTGDLAVMNEYGFIRIVGRIKDMVIRGGENIYPLEIENFISTHPAVQEVCVVGVPDKRMGEELCAWISLNEGSSLTEKEVKSFCSGKISHFKVPRYIMFVNEFPKTPSGKIKKFEVAELSMKKLNL